MNSPEAATKITSKVKAACSTLNLGSLVGFLCKAYQVPDDRYVMTTSFTEMTIRMLGLIVLKVKLLEVLKRLCEQQAPVPVEGTINSIFFPDMLTTLLRSVFGFLCRSCSRVYQAWQTKARWLNIQSLCYYFQNQHCDRRSAPKALVGTSRGSCAW